MGITDACARLEDIQDLAGRLALEHDDPAAQDFAMDYWSTLAKAQHSRGLYPRSLESLARARSFADRMDAARLVRLDTVAADALVKLAKPALAERHATNAFIVAGDDPYLQARSRYALQGALSASLGRPVPIVLGLVDLAHVADRHSPALAAVGAVLLQRAATAESRPVASPEPYLDLMDDYLGQESGPSLIQRLQVTEAHVLNAALTGDRSGAADALAELTSALDRVGEQGYRLVRVQATFDRLGWT
ncbi:hypothetical protein [Mesorhizobium japonicum]|uniref:hypothetical protein n=1 Tax=Mesorhizobium japonicum TaxID=2066070 RepID=UPI003B5B2063